MAFKGSGTKKHPGEDTMKHPGLATAVFGVALFAGPIFAQAQQVADIGKELFRIHCAVCHGIDGKGNGPIVGWLKKPAADLTKIQENNKGVFPFDRVYEVIDGREAIGAHGPREMPVWGTTFDREEMAKMGAGMFVTKPNFESVVRGRIVALIGYVYSLQAK